MTGIKEIIELMKRSVLEVKRGNVKKGHELLIRALRITDNLIESETNIMMRNKLYVLKNEILRLLNLVERKVVVNE